jgi:hypothetical protein
MWLKAILEIKQLELSMLQDSHSFRHLFRDQPAHPGTGFQKQGSQQKSKDKLLLMPNYP